MSQKASDAEQYGPRVAAILEGMEPGQADTLRVHLDTVRSAANAWRQQCLRERYRVGQWRERFAGYWGQYGAANVHHSIERDTREAYGAPPIAGHDSAFRYEREWGQS